MKRNWLYLFIFLLVFLLWSSAWLFLKWTSSNQKIEIADVFDPLNTLFSGLALAGVVVALLMQRKESETLDIQRFENTFFQMLNLHNQIVSSLYHKELNPANYSIFEYSGRKVFLPLIEDLLIIDNENKLPFSDGDKRRLDLNFSKFYTREGGAENVLEHYFKNIYSVFAFIEASKELSREQKEFYVFLLTSQLSKHELIMLVYFSLWEHNKLLLPFFRYSIFGNLGTYDKRLFPEWLLKLYHQQTSSFLPDVPF